MRRKDILLRVYAPTPGKRDFDKHLFDSYTRFLAQRSLAALSGFARRVCVFKMSRIGGAIQNTIATGNDAPRVSVRKRERAVSCVVKCPDSEPRAF